MQLTIESLYHDLDQMYYEIATESRLMRVGLSDTQDIEAIFKRYPHLSDSKTMEFAKGRYDEAKGSPHEEEFKRLYFTILGNHISQTLAPLQDKLQEALAKATQSFNGETIPYYELYGRLSKEKDFDKREIYGHLMEEVHREFTPQRKEILKNEIDLIRKVTPFENYETLYATEKNMDYQEFANILKASMERIDALYFDVIGPWVEERLKKPFKNINRYHVTYLMKGGEFDHLFPKEEMIAKLTHSLKRMDIDFNDYPNIKLDLEERPKKNPRASCYGARVPSEIHLILKPVGGLTDYDTFLHEGGHALHYGSTDENLPFPYRELSPSHALTETYAFLLQNLTLEVEWLKGMGVSEELAKAIRKEKVLADLYMYRRYVSKFLAELEFFRKDDLDDSSIYSRQLTEGTGFIYGPHSYLFDLDEGYYSADYLRAWIAEAQLANYLKKNYGEAWWINPKTGRFLKELWKEGTKPELENLITQLGYKKFDPGLLEDRFQELK